MVNMNPRQLNILLFGMVVGTLSARGDVLVGTNGERFIGTVVQETANQVVFDSEFAGRLVLPQSRVREIQRTSPPVTHQASPITNAVSVVSTTDTNTPASARSWKPPGVGKDGSDWVQLKSGEWLKGNLKYVQNKLVEFDSDEMDQQTLKLKNVSQIYTAKPVFTQFEDREPAYGTVVVSNDVVTVLGDEPFSLTRDMLIGITPSGRRTGIRNWSGDAFLGFSLQSGNHDQTTISASVELARRTPATTFLLNYLGNYSEANGDENANNNRLNTTYDIRLNKHWFVRPEQTEAYQDHLANVEYRLTGGVGAGYYIFDRTGLEWTVAAGPSYQYTKFSTVESGQSDNAATPALLLESKFKADITRRLTFIQSWQSTFMNRESGQYTHHTVTTLEFEVKRHLNLDVSMVWDYLQNPQVKSDGSLPQKSDLFMTVGLGVRF
jgi:hypothetical protein